MFNLDLEKAEEQEIKLPIAVRSERKQETFRKTSTSVLLTTPNPLCESQQTVENSSRDGNTRPHDMPPEKFICKSKSKLELDMEQQTGSILGKEYINAVYCYPAHLTYMQSTSCKMPGWVKHKLKSRLRREV